MKGVTVKKIDTILHSVHNDHKGGVFVSWFDKNSSGCLTLSAEEAIAIGQVGQMVKAEIEELERANNVEG
jgi:hypothetical protein